MNADGLLAERERETYGQRFNCLQVPVLSAGLASVVVCMQCMSKNADYLFGIGISNGR